MGDQFTIQSNPKLVGTVLLSAFFGYIGYKAFDRIVLGGESSSSPTNMMFRWLLGGQPKLLQNKEQDYDVPLIERVDISHDTRRFRYGLPSKNHVLGLPVGQHIAMSATVNDQQVTRKYTPVSSDEDKGYFDLVIKVYFKDVHPRFPEGGKLTQQLNDMKIGDTIKVRGPLGRLVYNGKGEFRIEKDKSSPPEKRQYKKLSMVAGGTGIAPMLQLIREVLKKNDVDKTKIALLFANQSEKDILLRDELEDLAKRYPEQFKFWYTIDRPSEGWNYSSGFVTKEMIQEHLYEANDETLVLMCGPPPMIKHVNSELDALGYPAEHRFKY